MVLNPAADPRMALNFIGPDRQQWRCVHKVAHAEVNPNDFPGTLPLTKATQKSPHVFRVSNCLKLRVSTEQDTPTSLNRAHLPSSERSELSVALPPVVLPALLLTLTYYFVDSSYLVRNKPISRSGAHGN